MTDKTLFIVNPISGNGRKKRMLSAIRKHYSAAPYEVVFTEYRGHAVEIAREADVALVVAVGGDGTVSEVARGIVESGSREKCLGILPCGSGDGLALHVGMSRRPRRAVRQLNGARPVAMDYATIEDGSQDSHGAFFCTAGVGFDADVADAFARSGSRGLWSYIKNALRLWRRFEPKDYKVIIDGETIEGKATMITVGNASQWGNNARIAPLASVCDGLLDVSFAGPFTTLRIPALAFRLLTGRLAGAKELQIYKGRNITICRDGEGAAHYDGDPCIMGGKIEIKVHPSAMKIAVPASKKFVYLHPMP